MLIEMILSVKSPFLDRPVLTRGIIMAFNMRIIGVNMAAKNTQDL
jgi:hypothetical protein